jgi:dolichyl-phosphate-mannose-protein mannosyltransferase
MYPAKYLGQQQVTTYSHKDSNNDWIVLPPRHSNLNISEPVLVSSGDRIRLIHSNTLKAIYSPQASAFHGWLSNP